MPIGSRVQMTALTMAGVFVATTAGCAGDKTLDQPPPGTATTGPLPGVVCDLALPSSPADVRIRVLDGGAPTGQAGATVAGLRKRTFTVLPGVTAGGDVAGAAALRYGPAAIGAATVIRAEVTGDVSMRFDPGRTDETVDLALGPAFTGLATPTEVNQNLAAVGEPSAPPECSTTATRTPGR